MKDIINNDKVNNSRFIKTNELVIAIFVLLFSTNICAFQCGFQFFRKLSPQEMLFKGVNEKNQKKVLN